MSEVTGRARVLFVDDEQNVLQGLARQVRSYVDAEVTASPKHAARLLEEEDRKGSPGFAAIVSDMRMPGMNGVALLEIASFVCPDTTRLLLTGHSDVEAAISAVNQCNIFRFLTKPCPPQHLHRALVDAIKQHELLSDRRDLLDRTLRGAIQALIETLAMAHPAAFARALRLRRLTHDVVEHLHLLDGWQVEIAAQLGEIGLVTLPPEALDLVIQGTPIDDPVVARMVAALPGLADGVLKRIPRLEGVREIVMAQEPVDTIEWEKLAKAGVQALVVQAVREYDALIMRNFPPASAIQLLRQRKYHQADILDALAGVASKGLIGHTRQVNVDELCVGQTIGADLHTEHGLLLVSSGHVLTEEMIARICNFNDLSGLANRPVIMVES